jgi:tetratricopeptide (TPR) repeat protein
MLAASDAAARLAYEFTNAGADALSLRLPPRQQIGWLEAALAGCRRLGDRGGEGQALGNLGSAWAALGETCKAIEHYEQQLVIAREIGDRGGENTGLYNLANVLDKAGERERAVACVVESLRIHREMEDPWAPKVEAWLRKRGIEPP